MSTDEHGRLTDDLVRDTFASMRARVPQHHIGSARDEFDAWLAAREDKARAEVVATVEAVLSRHARYPVDDEFLGWTPVDEIREALADHSDALDRVRNDAARIVSRDLSPAAADLARREGWATHARMHPATGRRV